jgi:hypothetical protein
MRITALKRPLNFTELHGLKSQKTGLFRVTAVVNPNTTKLYYRPPTQNMIKIFSNISGTKLTIGDGQE